MRKEKFNCKLQNRPFGLNSHRIGIDISSIIIMILVKQYHNKYQTQLTYYLIRNVILSHPFFPIFQDRYCEVVFRFLQGDFRKLDGAVSILEYILRCSSLFPDSGFLEKWKVRNYEEFGVEVIETEKFVVRDPIQRLQQSTREMSTIIEQQYCIGSNPIIWKILETQVPIIIGKLMEAVAMVVRKTGDHFPMLKPLLNLHTVHPVV